MKEYKVLNLYACLGGNRYKWDEVAEEAKLNLKVTAVELDPELAKLYKERFPKDEVIVADAHEFLLNNYKDFNFIWSSPPCPTHSRFNFSMKTVWEKMRYPDMKLYEEIIFLKYWFDGKFCIENVIPYYEPLIPAKKRGRHLYWSNFALSNNINERKNPELSRGTAEEIINRLNKYHNYNFRNYKGKQDVRKIARNLVDYEAGKTIFEIALNIYKKNNAKQTELF